MKTYRQTVSSFSHPGLLLCRHSSIWLIICYYLVIVTLTGTHQRCWAFMTTSVSNNRLYPHAILMMNHDDDHDDNDDNDDMHRRSSSDTTTRCRQRINVPTTQQRSRKHVEVSKSDKLMSPPLWMISSRREILRMGFPSIKSSSIAAAAAATTTLLLMVGTTADASFVEDENDNTNDRNAFSSKNSSTNDEEQTVTSIATKKPFAPLEKLLPAARVKWTIDQSIELIESTMGKSSTMMTKTTDNGYAIEEKKLLSKLKLLLLPPKNFYVGESSDTKLSPIPDQPAKVYMDTYERNRQKLNILAKPGAVLVQSGEIAAWKRLKRQERYKEEDDEIRAALNIYTSSLTYRSDAYILNVSSSERSQMIRQDRLPDIKQVIQSDMGVRYLYRNELLTKMQDVKAELAYQLTQQEVSFEDLLVVLQQAQKACNEWFSYIDDKDVNEAMDIVRQEQQKFSK